MSKLMTKRLILLPLLLLTMQVAWAEKVAQALVLNDHTMYFIFDEPVSVGSTYKGQTVSQVWSGDDVIVYPKWENNDIATPSTRVVFDPSFAAVRPTSCKYWFLNFFSLSVIEGLQYLNTSEVTSMYNMFANCSALTTLDVTTFDTHLVTNMGGMFQGCSSLTTLNLGSFNTDKVDNMIDMFKNCTNLKTIYVNSHWTTASVDVFNGCGTSTLTTILVLDPTADQTAVLESSNNKTFPVMLSGRTLYKDGSWNTLCLPFDVTVYNNSPLGGDGVVAMTLNTNTSSLTNGTLTLNFTEQTNAAIPAGTPFIIKWSSGNDIINPTFAPVLISNATHDVTVPNVLTFKGTYAPVSITATNGDNTKLYLGSANTLYWPDAPMTIANNRAYFQLADGITAGQPTTNNPVRAFVLNFDNSPSTAVTPAAATPSSSAWFTLDGRPLISRPTIPGIYIHAGKKIKAP